MSKLLPAVQRAPLMIASVRANTGLQMTDYFFLFTFFMVSFWGVDPMGWHMELIPGIKRLPSMFLVLIFSFIVVARMLFRRKNLYFPFGAALKDFRLLLCFALMVIGGSLYAKYRSHIDETFLTTGVYVLLAPLTYWYVRNADLPERLLRSMLAILILVAIFAAVKQGFSFRKLEVFHNREHLVYPVLVVSLFVVPNFLSKLLAVVVAVAVAVAANKITSFMLALLVFAYLMGLVVRLRFVKIRDGLTRFTWLLGVLTVAAFGVSALTLIFVYFEKYLPSGNTSYRLHMYGIAWGKFIHSPIWGNFFTKASVERFDLFEVAESTQDLPTHSDPLDVLANGGLIAFFCWGATILRVLWFALKDVGLSVHTQNIQRQWIFHTIFLICLMGFVVCMFNPIFNSPNLSAAYWILFGCAASLRFVLNNSLITR